MRNVLATLDGQPLILAQPEVGAEGAATTADPNDPNAGAGEGGGGLFGNPMVMIILVGMMILWIFLLGGGSRKQKKKQQELLNSMSKGSKIVTIGGIKGSVVEVREDEVVVKVDENNNTRMKFSKDAIRTVLDNASAKEEKSEKDDKAEEKDEK